MADVLLPEFHVKVGTKAQYTSKKSSLDTTNTLVLTPLSSEFTSNTTTGKGQFGIGSNTITTLYGTVGAENTSMTPGTMKPVWLSSGTVTAATATIGHSGTTGGMTAGTARPIFMNAGTLQAITESVGSNNTTNGYYPVYLNSGIITKMSVAIPVDQVVSSSTYYPIYMANDTTAGSIDKINMAAQATYSFNPSTKKWKYTTTDGTALDFGLTKVATW